MSENSFNPALYANQLHEKLAMIRQDFADLQLPQINVFESPPEYYRMRAEFRVWHKGDTLGYVMFTPDEYRRIYDVTSFPVGSLLINELMPRLLVELNSRDVLRKKLYQVDFLTTLSGESLAAQQMQETLNTNIVGRSRKQKLVVGRDYVIEKLQVNAETFTYQQIESGFTQPNAQVCQKMLSWAVEKSRGFNGDLLELYCGNGNFTLPLAQNFAKVLATELAKPSLNSAVFNIELNGIKNVALARMSSQEFVQAFDKVRPFKRLQHINLDDYQFSTLFVDPPRAGLDPETEIFSQRFDNIIYISCNPATLHQNLLTLTQTHTITDFAVFDQFPYTHHLECGVILRKK
jgi:tRNA (uracil-5-)-methyltransferase